MIHRRGFIAGLGALLAAPAVVRAGSLMPVRRAPLLTPQDYLTRVVFPYLDQIERATEHMLMYGSASIEVGVFDGIVGLRHVSPHDVYRIA